LKWRKSWEIEEMVSESRMNDAFNDFRYKV